MVIHEGNETKTDGTYSGNALLPTAFTPSAAMEAVELDVGGRQLVGSRLLSQLEAAHAPNTLLSTHAFLM